MIPTLRSVCHCCITDHSDITTKNAWWKAMTCVDVEDVIVDLPRRPVEGRCMKEWMMKMGALDIMRRSATARFTTSRLDAFCSRRYLREGESLPAEEGGGTWGKTGKLYCYGDRQGN